MKLLAWTSGSLVADPEGLAALRAARHVRLVSVIGPCRTGKSWLANQLCGRSAFVVTNGNPETKGAQLSPLVTRETTSREPGFSVGFIDVEGFGDGSPSQDAKLAVPVLAVSTTIILNVDQGNFGVKRMLEDVSLIAHAASRAVSDLQAGAAAGGSTTRTQSQKAGPPFGALHIVYRNWTNASTAEQIRSKLLTDEEGSSEAATASNARRAVLRAAFARIAVHCLPPPAADAVIRDSQSLPIASATADFRRELEALRLDVEEDLRAPAPSSGLPASRCSGPMAAGLLEHLAADAGGALSIPTALQAAREGAARAAVESVAAQHLKPLPADRLFASYEAEPQIRACCEAAATALSAELAAIFEGGNLQAVTRHKSELAKRCEAFRKQEAAAASQRLAAVADKVEKEVAGLARSIAHDLSAAFFSFEAPAGGGPLRLQCTVRVGSGKNLADLTLPAPASKLVDRIISWAVFYGIEASTAATDKQNSVAISDALGAKYGAFSSLIQTAVEAANERATEAARHALDKLLAASRESVARAERELAARPPAGREELRRALQQWPGVAWPSIESPPSADLSVHAERCKRAAAKAADDALDRIAAVHAGKAREALRRAAAEVKRRIEQQPMADFDVERLLREIGGQAAAAAAPEDARAELAAVKRFAQEARRKEEERRAQEEARRRAMEEAERQRQRQAELQRQAEAAQRQRGEEAARLAMQLENLRLAAAYAHSGYAVQPSYSRPSSSASSSSGYGYGFQPRVLQTGPRGGQFYYTEWGTKVYKKR